MNNRIGLVQQNHVKSRDILSIPKHTFLMGYAVDDDFPVIGNLQQNNKFVFVSENDKLLITAMDNAVRRNKQVGFVIVSERYDYWMDMNLANTYIYKPKALNEVLDTMENEIELTDEHDIVLVIDDIDFPDFNLIKRMIQLKMFALFWLSDVDVAIGINEYCPDLTYEYKSIFMKNGICAVRKQSKWLTFTLS